MKYVEAIGRAIETWYTHAAEPWQFWWPQSGRVGGVIMGALIGGALVFFVMV